MSLHFKLFIIAFIVGMIIGGAISFLFLKEKKNYEFTPSSFCFPGIISKFVVDHYDENVNGFKMTETSPISLEAAYHAFDTFNILRKNMRKYGINISLIFDTIRTNYVQEGYYLEDDKDPIISTSMAIDIDSKYREDLNQWINTTWLESNSILNSNLESKKFDPVYQSYVLTSLLTILGRDNAKLNNITQKYLEYYCNYVAPDENYLEKKYHQIFIISTLNKKQSIHGNCLKKEHVEADKEKLSKIQINKNDIKEIFWLYNLKKFYNLKPDFEKAFSEIMKFYSNGGFKEYLNDKEANLRGTNYATRFVISGYDDYCSAILV